MINLKYKAGLLLYDNKLYDLNAKKLISSTCEVFDCYSGLHSMDLIYLYSDRNNTYDESNNIVYPYPVANIKIGNILQYILTADNKCLCRRLYENVLDDYAIDISEFAPCDMGTSYGYSFSDIAFMPNPHPKLDNHHFSVNDMGQIVYNQDPCQIVAECNFMSFIEYIMLS